MSLRDKYYSFPKYSPPLLSAVWAVQRPARPYKSAVQNRFTVEKGEGERGTISSRLYFREVTKLEFRIVVNQIADPSARGRGSTITAKSPPRLSGLEFLVQ